MRPRRAETLTFALICAFTFALTFYGLRVLGAKFFLFLAGVIAILGAWRAAYLYTGRRFMSKPAVATKPKKLIYDAKFSGPRGDLNPMGLKIPGWISVQLYPQRADKWTITNPDTKGRLSAHEFHTPDQAMAFLGEIFTKQETEWIIQNMDGTPHVVTDTGAVLTPANGRRS